MPGEKNQFSLQRLPSDDDDDDDDPKRFARRAKVQ